LLALEADDIRVTSIEELVEELKADTLQAEAVLEHHPGHDRPDCYGSHLFLFVHHGHLYYNCHLGHLYSNIEDWHCLVSRLVDSINEVSIVEASQSC